MRKFLFFASTLVLFLVSSFAWGQEQEEIIIKSGEENGSSYKVTYLPKTDCVCLCQKSKDRVREEKRCWRRSSREVPFQIAEAVNEWKRGGEK